MTCEKRTYETEKAAKAALKKIWGYANRGRKPLRSYRCEFCKKYHLTSKSFMK